MKILKYTLQVFSLLILSITTQAQQMPVSGWYTFMPYNSCKDFQHSGDGIYAITPYSFFIHNNTTLENYVYSKSMGMAEQNMAAVGYDELTETAVLGYTNGNIDLFVGQRFYNLPFLKLKTTTENKTIYKITCYNGLAYICTGLGIVVADLKKKEIKETYSFTNDQNTVSVRKMEIYDNFLYAYTNFGIYKASIFNPNLQAFSSWELLGESKNLITGAIVNGKIFVSGLDSIYVLENNSLRFVLSTNYGIQQLDKGDDTTLYISTREDNKAGQINLLHTTLLQVTDSFIVVNPVKALKVDDKIIVADLWQGLVKVKTHKDRDIVVPNSPADIGSYGIYAKDKKVDIAHGAYNDLYQPKGSFYGISIFDEWTWSNFNNRNNGYLKNATDFIIVKRHPVTNELYAGSLTSGLAVINDENTITTIKLYDSSSVLGIPNSSSTPVTGIAWDDDGNMWFNQSGMYNELGVWTKDGQVYRYHLNISRPLPYAAAEVLIDNIGQKWYYSPQGGGVIVYNDNNTLANANDDKYRQFLSGKGNGGLPSNRSYCLAKDKDGAIWVGTDNGIGIISCAENAFSSDCDAEMRIVQYDNFAGYLFQNEQVKAIAVDGANRKWIGTNNGVWLLSPDADKIIYRFTSDNSPLPSNTIVKIAIDPTTGDVYFGTDGGLICYKSTATEGAPTNDDLLIYPNPVTPQFSGQIAIKGLVENADVRITDISGQLLYKTTANGGQAIWDGRDYTGRRPQTGVYLVFVTNKEGTERKVGKLIFIE